MKKDTEKELLELLKKYLHYKNMTAGAFSSLTDEVGMSFYDFIQWLKTRNE